MPGELPDPLHRARRVLRRGEDLERRAPLCACKGSGQFDPIIEVVPDTGDVYAVFMIGFNVVFMRSTDHGSTWSGPIPTWGKVAWNDKPVLAMSDNGRHVYVSWNGPTGGDPGWRSPMTAEPRGPSRSSWTAVVTSSPSMRTSPRMGPFCSLKAASPIQRPEGPPRG